MRGERTGEKTARRSWQAVLVLGTLLACCTRVFGLDPSLDVSQYAHTAWKVRDGFTQGPIYCIAQTPDGYLWLGTESGLYRFDGVRALSWQPPDGQQLPSKIISALLVARDGTLWITTSKGLASWKRGKLTQYPEVAGSPAGPLLQDHDGTIWFGLQSPGRICAIQGQRAQCYGEKTFGLAVVTLYEDLKGNIWAAGTTGLWRWKPGPPKQYRFPRGTVEVNSLIESDDGILLLASNNGLKQLVDGKIQGYALPSVTGTFRPNHFFRSSDGSLWIGTQQDLLHLHNGRIDAFGSADGLSGDFTASIFEDHEDNVWVSTIGGLDRFREFAAPKISRSQGLSTNNAYSVQSTRDGAIWIGTSNGLNRWQNAQVTVYAWRGASALSGSGGEQELGIAKAVTNFADSGLTGTPHSLGQDDQERLWVSTSDGLFHLDGAHFVRRAFQGRNTIPGIVGDGRGNVWIGDVFLGLSHLTPRNAPQPISWSQLGQKNYGAEAFLPDRSDGGLWLGFLDGGIAYFKDGHIRASYTAADGLGKGRVDDLRFGTRGTLWVATESGLSHIQDGRIQTLTSENGLPCDTVHWSIEDDDHFVWIYTYCGLVRTPESELDAWVNDSKRAVQTRVFDVFDGVGSVGVYGGYGPHVTKSPNGKIWFVTYDGVSVIDPRHLPFNKLPPPVHVEQITADRKNYWQNLYGDASSPPPKLPPLIRDLEIDYSALSYVAPEKNRFRVKLEGWDRDWQDVGNRREAFYNNLSPGNYRFRVIASNNSGIWNDAGTFLDFSITPAYYQTNWFRALCVAAFIAMLWALYQYRVRQMAREFNMSLEARVGERTRIARDLHDTLLQSFHGLLLRFQTVSNELPPGDAKEKLDSAIDQAAEAITEGRDAVQGLRASTVVMNDLAVAVRTIGEELSPDATGQNAVEFSVQVEGTPRNLRPILRDEVYRIAGEALRNAFKHAQARQIEVEIHYDERRLRLRVRDDGRGIDPKILSGDGRAGHYGLHGMRERAKLMGGKLAVWSELDSGTEVELSIPASNAYEGSDGPRSWLSELAGKLSGKGTAMKS